jgi:hypothetical protein
MSATSHSSAMSPTSITALNVEVPRFHAFYERRKHTRYPVELEVSYRFPDTDRVRAVVGQTVNISSRGILLTTSEVQPIGARIGTKIELTIRWPVGPDGVDLNFVVRGRVARSDGSGTAVEIARYEFRTRSRGT